MEAVVTLLSHVPRLALLRLLVLMVIKLNLNSPLSHLLGRRPLGGRLALLLLCPQLALASATWSLRGPQPTRIQTNNCL